MFHWDLVARNPRDATWYFDPDNKEFMSTEDIRRHEMIRSLHGFRDVKGKKEVTDNDFHDLLVALVEPVRVKIFI